MTVGELRELLKDYPDYFNVDVVIKDMEVVVPINTTASKIVDVHAYNPNGVVKIEVKE